MSIRHPYNPVFPVVLVSSIAFSILSLPFFLYHSQVDSAASSFHQGFQPVLESKNRDLTIRYIGAAMVLSVVTGISTVEVQRKRQARRTSAAVKLSELDQEMTGAFVDVAPLHDAEETEPMGAAETLATATAIESLSTSNDTQADLASLFEELIAEHQGKPPLSLA